MSRPVYTFSAGPCIFPLEVLYSAKAQLPKFFNMGQDSELFKKMEQECKDLTRELLNVPSNYEIFYMQGGATSQFAAVVQNFLGRQGNKAEYIVTGTWSMKASQECKTMGGVPLEIKSNEAKKKQFVSIPDLSTYAYNPESKYLYYCDNETIHGVEYHTPPSCGPFSPILVTDMTSNFFSKPVDVSQFGLIYAGAQKNYGPPGLSTIIIRKDLLGGQNELEKFPSEFSYAKLTNERTSPLPVFALLVTREYLLYMKKKGGMTVINQEALDKSNMVYNFVDNSKGFYKNLVHTNCRSRMNIPFIIRNNDKDLTEIFKKEALKKGMMQIAGHRSMGGIRLSIYNGMPKEGVLKMLNFMKEFMNKHQMSQKL